MIRLLTLRHSSLFLRCLLVLGAAGCASTSPGMREGVDGAFIRAAATWDLNHDGNVTCDEWKAYALSLFKEVDRNHDGKLTPDEFERLPKIDRLFETADFKYFDAESKGYVTQSDFVDKPNPAFLQLDKDKTCVLKTHQLRASIEQVSKPENPAIANPPNRR